MADSYLKDAGGKVMGKITDKDMQNQRIVGGEFKVENDPDGSKRKLRRRADFLQYGIRTIFALMALALLILVMVTK